MARKAYLGYEMSILKETCQTLPALPWTWLGKKCCGICGTLRPIIIRTAKMRGHEEANSNSTE